MSNDIGLNNRLQFSGHESFACKQFWLKKGYDFKNADKSFHDDSAVVDLGVGKNMVNSIRYWIKAFNVIDDYDNVTDFGKYIFEGKDPYIEYKGTVWLLHYYLVKKNKASIYSLLFNEFRKERLEFTKNQLHTFLKRKCYEDNSQFRYNENTITADINVLLKNYSRPEKHSKFDVEDTFSNVFLDLDIFEHYKKRSVDGEIEDWYKIDSSLREDLPFEIVLFTILDSFENVTSLSFRQLLVAFDSPGSIFAMNSEGLYKKIIAITKRYKEIVYSETAGNQVLQIKEEINKWDVLNEYYK
jgi:hypothetical protein